MDDNFIGYKDDLEELKTKQESSNKQKAQNQAKKPKLTYNDIKGVPLQIMNDLKNVYIKNDFSTVYMMPDIHTYDEFYHREYNKEADELLVEARNIKKIYKDYTKYLNACYIYDKYIDTLIEKYGGIDRFNMSLASDCVTDWIPRKPIFSKNSPDYELSLLGIIDTQTEDNFDEEVVATILGAMMDEFGIDPSELETRGDVLTDRYFINSINDQDSTNSSSVSGSVNISDLNQLQRIFSSWFTDEKKQTRENIEMFSKTEKGIREAYFKQAAIDLKGQLNKIMNGIDITEEEFDPNEMVTDPVSNRPMTRADLEARKAIRLLQEDGWNEVKLMQRFGTASKYELSLLQRKSKNKKRNKRASSSLAADILGSNDYQSVDSIEDMQRLLFNV